MVRAKRVIMPKPWLLAAAIGLAACQPNTAPTAKADTVAASRAAVAAQDTQAWAGEYRGELPCPNCDYIEATLSLAADLSYQLTTRHVGRVAGELPQQHRGRFHWRPDGLLQLDATGDNMVFFVDGRQLQMRGNDGKAYANFKGQVCALEKTGVLP